eukprot:9938250-Ditylum_brightwellii.AAC.1
MHHTIYAHKNWTVESLWKCFKPLHCIKAPSSDPSIPAKAREAKLAWLQIHARSECSMCSCNEEEDGGDYEGVKEVEEDDSTSQELLEPIMAQLIPTLLSKKVIKLENEDISVSEDSTDMSTFEAWPFKKVKVVIAKKEKVVKTKRRKDSGEGCICGVICIR